MNFINYHHIASGLIHPRVNPWISAASGRLKKLYLKQQTPYWFRNITFREDKVVTGVNLASIVAKGSDDPWFLVTNLKKAESCIKRYEQRFTIEEWFKDLKHQLGIANMQTTNLKRVRRILFISVFSFTLLALIGKVAQRRKKVLQTMITGKIREVASIIWYAGMIIEHDLLKAQFWKKVRMVGVAS